MAEPVNIPLLEGEQWWELYCSDTYGLSADEIISDKIRGLATALDAILSQAKGQPFVEGPWQKFGTGDNTYRLGNARPVEILSVGKTMAARPAGKVLADRNTYAGDGIPTVQGQQPWYVAIRIWWRAPDDQLPWPTFTSRLPALPDLSNVIGSDWVLATAVQPTAKAKDPGDATWGSVQADRAVETAKKIGSGILDFAMVLGVVAVAGTIFVLTIRGGGGKAKGPQ
jgi:hypothetical protein